MFYLLLVLFVSVAPLSSAGAATCAALPTDKGSASTSFAVASTGAYHLWAHVHAPSTGKSALNLTIDGGCPIKIGGATQKAETFNWLDRADGAKTPVVVNLTAGAHSLVVAGQDPEAGLDEVLLASNSSCVPTGDGGNCVAGARITVNDDASTARSAAQQSKISGGTVAAIAVLGALMIGLLALALRHFVARQDGSLGHKRYKGKIWIALGPCVLVIGAFVAVLVARNSDKSIIVSLAHAKVTGQAQVAPSSTAITGYLVQFGKGATSAQPTATQQSPAPAPSPVSNPGPGPITVTASKDISCNYQENTWSGDAPTVGYRVSTLASSDGNPASFSAKLDADRSNTEVVGYPSVQCLLYSALPSNLVSAYATTPPPASNGLDYEFAYDVWLTTASAAQSSNWDNDLELMIWTYTNGQTPAGSVKATLADGSKVWVDGDNRTGIVSIVLPSNKTSGTVNISDIVSQLKSRGFVATNYDGILDVEYGIEAPYGGGQTFTLNSFTVGK